MVVMVNLVNVAMPQHFNYFFTGAVMIAAMDLFNCEYYYSEYFTFKETQPLTDKFSFFEVEDLNFTMNSGSLYGMALAINLESLLRFILNQSYPITRFHGTRPKSSREELQRLHVVAFSSDWVRLTQLGRLVILELTLLGIT